MKPDLDHAAIYSVVSRHVINAAPQNLHVRLNFYHRGLNRHEHIEEYDRIMTVGPTFTGAYMAITQTPEEGTEIQETALSEQRYGFCNYPFCATMTLVDESNLMNGIVEIPNDVCAQYGLSVWRGPPMPSEAWLLEARQNSGVSTEELVQQFQQQWMEKARQDKREPIKTYFAIPYDHVLSWGFQDPEYSAHHGIYSLPLMTPPPNSYVLYWMLPDVAFRALHQTFCDNFLNSVDLRPLSSVGWEGRFQNETPQNQPVVLSSWITYTAPPILSPAQKAALYPALHPEFPHPRLWNISPINAVSLIGANPHSGSARQKAK